MQIISLNNHIVRKALCLSLNEMAVLCDIKQMSQEQKFGYTCIKSKDKIAEWLDLSRSTVFTIIDALIKKGYIEKNEIGLKPTSFIYQLDMCQEDIGLWLKNGGVELVTKKIQDILTPCTDSPETGLPPSRNWTQVYNIDSNTIKEKYIKENSPSDSIPINQVTDNPDEIKKGGGGGPAAAKKPAAQSAKENLKEQMALHKDKYSREMLNEFYLYWTEASQSKKDRVRYQDEKYFDVGRRLATWNKNANKNKYGETIQTPKSNSNIKFNIQ